MSKIEKITLLGYFGYHNAGDELILRNILVGLRSFLPGVFLTVLYRKASSKSDYSKNVRYVERYNPLAIVRTLLGSDMLLMAGGSLIQDISGNFTIYYYLLIMTVAKLTGNRLIIFNQGVGPVKGYINRLLTKIIFSNADLIIVRDEYSLNYTQDLTGGQKEIILGADPVFDIPPSKYDERKDDAGPKKVGFSVRKWKLGNASQIINEAASELKRMGYDCYDIPFQFPDDKIIFGSIRRIEWDSLDDLYSAVSGMDYIVGMRLHSLIMGVILGKPVMGIDYDPKVTSFCSFMGVPCIKPHMLECSYITDWIAKGPVLPEGHYNKLLMLHRRLILSWEKLRTYAENQG